VKTYGLQTKATIGIVVLAVVVMTGCQGLSTPGTSGPSLSFAETNVTFGSVPVGKTKTFTETITNSSPAASVVRAGVGIGANDSKGGTGGVPTTASNDVTILQISSSSSSYTVEGITLPVTLTPGQTATFKVKFAPKSKGTQAGNLSISTSQTAPMSVALMGTGSDPSTLSASPSALSFGNVQNGTTDTIQETLSNSGASTVTISSIVASGTGFSLNGLSTPVVLDPGETVKFNARFSPTSSGSQTGSFTVTSDASNSSLKISATGSGMADGGLAASPSSVNFGSVQVGVTQTLTQTLTNSGGSPLKITGATATGAAFSMSGLTVPLTLNAGQSTSFSVKFKPTATGAASGSINVTSDGSNPNLSIALTGSGVADGALTSSPASINFGTIVVGSNQTVTETLTNSGGSSLKITGASASGSGFSLSGLALPVTLNSGQSVSFSAKFAPTAAGNATGSVTITSDGSNPTLNIPLSGNGAADGALSASPSSLNFGSVVVGNNQTITETLTNSGGSSLKITAAAASGTGFSLSGLTLPLTLNSGQSVSFSVKFAPAATGNATGSVTVTSDGSNPTLNIPLSGNGAADGALSASPSSVNFGSVVVGNNDTVTETLTNSGGSSLKITAATASGAGFSLTGITLPVTLNSGQSVSFSVKFAPTSAGNATGSVTVTSDGSNPTLTIPLSGKGAAEGALAPSPSSVNFGSVQVGTNQTISETLTNSGGSNVQITAASASGTGFSISGLALPATLSAGQTVSFTVKFAPTGTGSATGNITVTSDGSNPMLDIPLSGTGVADGAVTASPSTVAFGTVVVGSNQTITQTLTNSGGSSLKVTAATVSGSGFTMSGLTLPATLNAGQSVSFSVKFAPTSTGSATGSLIITSDGSNPTMTVPLSGSGVADGGLSASPTSLSFGSVQVGNNQSINETLTNSGGSDVKITAASASGSGYSLSGLTLPVTLSAGQTVSFSVKFAPTAGGSATGNVTITSDGSNPTLNIPLSGTGVSAGTLSANPSSLAFGSVQVGNNSSKSETITNTGGSSVTITGASSGAAAFSVSGLSLPTTLTAGQSVTFSVVFAPASAGSASANLTVTSNASNPSLAVALTGTGTAPGQLGVSPASQSFGSVTVGSSGAKTGTLSATGSAVQVTGVTSDSPEFVVSGISFPATIGAGGTASFTVTFTPSASGTATGNITFASNASNGPTVQALTGSGTAPLPHSVDLSWSASSGSGVVGYNIYRGTKTGGPYNKVNSSLNTDTTFTDSSVTAGATYFYVVTAVDGAGTESPFSNEAKAVIPTP